MLESRARVKMFLEAASSLLIISAYVLISTKNAEGACVEPCLYYANETTLKRLQVQASSGHVTQGTKIETIYNKGKRIGPIALDHVRQRIFWSDLATRGIYKAYLNGTGDQELIKYGIGLCEGIAYDWSTDNIYWTDSLHDWIEVASSDGRNRMVLINGSMHSPRGIAVTPFDSFVFWSDFGKNPRIERATLDGKNRRAIVTSSLVWPNDLAIDFSTKRVYWIDAYEDKIESTDYSGGGRVIHTDVSYQRAIRMHPYSMTLFFQHSLAYFTDWFRSIVLYQRLQSTAVVPNIAANGRFLVRQIGQVRLMHTSNQPPSSSQCLTNRSICSHICLKKNAADYSCACPTGMRLTQQGGRVCQKDDLDYQAFLLDGTNQSSKIFHISKFVSQAQYVFDTLKLPKSGLPVGVDFDPMSGVLYWSDVHLDKILTMSVHGSGYKALVNRNLRTPEGVAVDPVSKLLYFADYARETIEVVKLDGSARKVLISTDLVNPRDIKIYHEMGLMFISDWGRDNPKIESAFLDGTGRKRVIASSIRTPSGLAIDKIENRLYWCDIGLDRIESSKLDGSDRRILFDHFGYDPYVPIDTITGEIQTPFGLSLFRDRVYWTDWATRSVYSADKRTGGKISLLSAGFIRPMQIHVYSNHTKKEFKKIYFFSHARHSPSVNFTCFETSCHLNVIEEPAMCPPGFKQTKLNTTCVKCATKFGLYGRRCPCSDWMTCAHRAYLKSSCPNRQPYMHFKVRECVQAVNPGFCPSYKCGVGATNTSNCKSDDDCNDSQKCCKTACGMKCLKSSPLPAAHPCQNQNGGCSHFCFRMPSAFNRGFTCGCPDSMILQSADNKTCIQKSGYCAVHKPCMNRGVCTDNLIGAYNCTCRPGYYGNRCQNRSNNCTSTSCQNNGNCTMVADKMKCLCPPAFTGPKCESSMVCLYKPCLHNGSCVTSAQGYLCMCNYPFTGKYCETHFKCSPNPCQNNGQCSVVGNQVKCNCPSGYTGNKCQTSMACYPNPCQNNGQCTAVGNQVKCNCPPDYTGDKCQTSMACYPNPCQNNGQCTAVGNQVKCNCPSDYTGDKCQTSMACYPNPCQNNGQCTAVVGQARCTCLSDFTGTRCDIKLFCPSNPCHNGGLCNEMNTTYSCKCSNGYSGKSCETPPPCMSNPCQNSGTCNPVGTDNYNCSCAKGFTGKTCSIVDYCASNKCKNDAVCVNSASSYTCQCSQGFTGRNCDAIIDHCVGHSCQNGAACINSKTGYTCNCSGDYTGRYCESKINDCAGVVCKNSGTCIDGINSYHCNCKQYYTGKHCESVVDLCQSSYVCFNGGTCHFKQPDATRKLPYVCNCTGNFAGTNCELSYGGNLVEMVLSNSVSNLPTVPEIKDTLASKYTTYCAGVNCGDKTSARRKRESQPAVTVSKDDIIIPTGFPRSLGSSETEIQYAVIGQRNGVAFVLSSKVVEDGLKSIKAELEISLGVKIVSFKAVSQTPSSKPPDKSTGQQKSTSKRGLAAGLVVAVVTVVFVVLLAFYCRNRKRRNEQSVKFSHASFDDISSQPQLNLNSDGIVQIRNNKPTDKQNNFQFQNMMYENNDLYGEGLKVDLSTSGYSAEFENKKNMTGIVNPYAEVPEEAQGANYVERTNSTARLIADSPPVGLTSLDVVHEDVIKASPRSPPRSDDSELKGTLVQVQSNGLTAYENPSYGFVGSGAAAVEKSDEKTRELSTNEAGSRIDESSA